MGPFQQYCHASSNFTCGTSQESTVRVQKSSCLLYYKTWKMRSCLVLYVHSKPDYPRVLTLRLVESL